MNGCYRWCLPLAMTTVLVACNGQEPAAEAPAAAPAATPTATPAPEEPESSPTLAAGQYCYDTSTDTLISAVRLTVAADGSVTGDSVTSIQDPANDYSTAYRQALAGTLTGNQATLDITTWIEYDQQQTTATWTVDSASLINDDATYSSGDCGEIRSYFTGPDGLEAADLLSDASNVHRQQVQFEPGTSGAVVSNAVVRGDRDLYLLGAQGGQTMVVSITALEDNAAFAVVSPAGEILVLEGTNEEIFLPHTGDYQVIVGGTRGNASYDLYIAIE